jgi:ketosteroid isomerase-like protein
MNTPFEKELLGREKQYWQAIKDKDFDAALRLTDDPCIVTGAQGVARIDKATFKKMMSSSQWTLEDFSFADVSVEKLSDDVAIIGYKIREKLTVDGKPLELEAADASTWVKKNGEWVCALHTEAVAGDPFGRDKRKQQ